MVILSGFADEISTDLEVQIRTLAEENIRRLELRGVGEKNVLDFAGQDRQDIKRRLDDAGIKVSCIGSPIGKVRIDEPWPTHLERFKVALDMAGFFEAPYLRVFSFYPPAGGRIADHRDEVLRRLTEFQSLAEGRVRILHENEKDIYGENAEACADIAANVPGMKLIFDPANFVQAGVDTLAAWALLKPHVAYFHIKDALLGSGKVVLPGKGDGHVPEILRDAIARQGFGGFLSLEPHLAAAGQFAGFSGPELFKKATQSLKKILDNLGVEYQ